MVMLVRYRPDLPIGFSTISHFSEYSIKCFFYIRPTIAE